MRFDQRVYINHDNTSRGKEKCRELKTEMQLGIENGERDLVISEIHKKTKQIRPGCWKSRVTDKMGDGA